MVPYPSHGLGQSVGDATEKVVGHMLEHKRHPESGFRSCIALVDEGKRYGLERLETAASVALQINSITLSSIRSILRTGRDKLRLVVSNPAPVQPETPQISVHTNVRGSKYYR